MADTNEYRASEIEKTMQKKWAGREIQAPSMPIGEKSLVVSMLPYPSGQIHMGHVRNYTLGDVITRHHKLMGRDVMQPLGWDAFGLPAENAALKNNCAPAKWTYENIEQMKHDLLQLGFDINWECEFATCDRDYYRWEQWLFLKMFSQGLAYKQKSTVNWDPVDQTVLANEQVVDGKGWRSGAPVERREISQWFLKITEFADELLDGLRTLENTWPSSVITAQKNWIGRSKGTEVKFKVEQHNDSLTVFTTRADTLMGVSYLAIAPEHPLVVARVQQEPSSKLALFCQAQKNRSVAEADTATGKEGVFSGLYALHPITGERLPIWCANYVLMSYGSGAVMGVPAHDKRDHEFAELYHLPIRAVIQADESTALPILEKGQLFNSGEFDGLTSDDAIQAINQCLINQNSGQPKLNYRIHDWGISRQRYWGAPIPIIYCEQCGTVPVPESDLPVELPTDFVPKPGAFNLESVASFVETTCPSCGKSARRETDTFDTFMESSWYCARYSCPDSDQSILDERAKAWMPVDQYIGGVEHAVMHLLYARFIHKVLRDLGYVSCDEPFTRLLTQGMVLKDGSKMSKSKGNVIAPQALIEQYGADTIRLFIIFTAPPEQSLEWSHQGVEGAHRFLKKLYRYVMENKSSLIDSSAKNHYCSISQLSDAFSAKIKIETHNICKKIHDDYSNLQLNTVVSGCMKLLNILTDQNHHAHETWNLLAQGVLKTLLLYLYPVTPHLCDFLWSSVTHGQDILQEKWPDYRIFETKPTEVTIIVQVNGKLRARLPVANDSPKEQVVSNALSHEDVKKYLTGELIKTVYVPNKIVNFVVKV